MIDQNTNLAGSGTRPGWLEDRAACTGYMSESTLVANTCAMRSSVARSGKETPVSHS